MTNWNLRRVRETKSPCECCSPAHFIHVYEVYYDEKSRPWSYVDASLMDKFRFISDWLQTPVLTFPDDFTGEPAWIKELEELAKSADT